MSGHAPRRLLTIGHSYVVGMNRRLAHEMAMAGGAGWRVTAVAPATFRGDLRRMAVEPIPAEANSLETLSVAFDRSPHFMWYRDLARVMDAPWDVVHCWEEPFVLAGAQIARHAPAASRFIVATFQNIIKRYPWPLGAFERATMARADAWVAFGHTVHDAKARAPLYAAKPSRVIPPGVDVCRFTPDEDAGRAIRDRLAWGRDDLVVGFLGRFVAQKGVGLLMDALGASQAPWRALFVGGGPLGADLRRFAQGFPGRVHIETSVAHDDVPSWLNAMSILCAPSQTTAGWREQFGRMLIEGMACGVPVVASDSGEMPSVVGDAGIIVPERDGAGWTTAIDRLLGSEASRRECAGRGLERARSYFAWPVVARAHLSFFAAIADGRAA